MDRRGAHPVLESAQNWESGIELTISSCTFFRNFASVGMGAMSIYDAWPLVLVDTGSDYIHSESFVCYHYYVTWLTPVRQSPALFCPMQQIKLAWCVGWARSAVRIHLGHPDRPDV